MPLDWMDQLLDDNVWVAEEWGEQQNRPVNSQIESARESGLDV